MNICELEGMIRQEISEIYQRPEIRNLEDFIGTLGGDVEMDPKFTDPDIARRACEKTLDRISIEVGTLLKAALENKEAVYKQAANKFNLYRQDLMMFLVRWVQKTYGKNKELGPAIVRPITDIKNHLDQMQLQVNNALSNMLQWKNYINAVKEAKHLKEIIDNTKKSVHELFDVIWKAYR